MVYADRRQIAAEDFFAGFFTTALEDGELVVAVSFPTDAECGYAKFRNPASRYAMAGVFRWAEAEERLARNFAASEVSMLSLPPEGMIGDMHGTAEYRAHLAAVMLVRAVENIGRAVVTP